MSENSSIETRLASYIQSKMQDAQNVRVDNLDRIPGGASRETFRFILHYEQAGTPKQRKLILRRDLPQSLLESERKTEFGAFQAFANTPVPVPEMLWLEEDASYLDHPFFISQELAGFEASPYALIEEPYASLSETIGQRKYAILGEIAKTNPLAIGYDQLCEMPTADNAWKIALDYWAGVLRDDAIRAEPILQAVIRWMYRNPPPPAQKVTVVHGDYRSGNFLFDTKGEIQAILDWEMTHLGDPLEDLAWSFLAMWTVAKDERRGGLLLREDAIKIWEETSGLKADAKALHWWDLLACVKGQALWVSAGDSWLSSELRETVHLSTPWLVMDAQDLAALEVMERI